MLDERVQGRRIERDRNDAMRCDAMRCEHCDSKDEECKASGWRSSVIERGDEDDGVAHATPRLLLMTAQRLEGGGGLRIQAARHSGPCYVIAEGWYR